MTLNEIAYNILNSLRGGRSSHDEHISIDQIKFNIKHYRAMLIRRDFARNGIVTRHLEQDLGCLKLIQVDASKCCSLPSECVVYRTELKVPKTVRFNFKDAITYIGDISGKSNIPIVDSHMVEFLPWDKYTKNKYKAYMIQDYIYVYNADGLEYINVRGVFEDPEDLRIFDCGDAGGCYDDGVTPFPIPMDMVQGITQSLMSGELRLMAGTFSDTENNRAQDDKTIGGGAPPQQPKE
tara:strand:- start:2161 stop:2871 length:711 start_codon:yes stop_codon:yes gene_type:complete